MNISNVEASESWLNAYLSLPTATMMHGLTDVGYSGMGYYFFAYAREIPES